MNSPNPEPTMRAMVLRQQGAALQLETRPRPLPGPGQLLVRVSACGICRTDLHVVDGDLTEPNLPLVPGHQIVGTVEAVGARTSGFALGERVGVPWLGGSCGHCEFCESQRENLCDNAIYTGYQFDGGFAEYTVADARYCFGLPGSLPDEQVAPLLCAGLIGYRAYKQVRQASSIGLYGFGAAGHLLVQLARHNGQQVYAFTRSGDMQAQSFARELGACWAGSSAETPPELLDAAIIFAPVGALVPAALKVVKKGGTVVCAGIHMSDIPGFPYADLWGERSIVSVANLTRQDAQEYLPLAASIPVNSETHSYSLEKANEALADLREGKFTGAAVLLP